MYLFLQLVAQSINLTALSLIDATRLDHSQDHGNQAKLFSYTLIHSPRPLFIYRLHVLSARYNIITLDASFEHYRDPVALGNSERFSTSHFPMVVAGMGDREKSLGLQILNPLNNKQHFQR
ncbi:hypothetical protein BJ138DRAFT_1146603 [Hygrophoropsis aurantiaca]|uniref:Uncharacterized protein n=1 Tax=Hygrophoropsis aurantiaca TaxID=72124 RepID=A0ACB8AIP1_9AGAM|nr:hypothetical protein BJ138DRAFT_1146603 [Hygrophoropsis aurantiaca]